ncbi:Protein kinase domain-containing protein [Aphelenchoides fujianensis]|nr:Protein kinase domain-containing protein [Aphelenchoides fujianensis]
MAAPTEIVQLAEGTRVERWTIVKKLGEGGFGAVYRVTDGSGDFALKVEGVGEAIQVLKMEVFVLSELAKRGGRHFCKIEDRGRFGAFNYVVMNLVGKSLYDLRKAQPSSHFSLGTALGCGIQCLEALEDLHGIGYLHRDVKPGNYTVGRADVNELRKMSEGRQILQLSITLVQVYILDFGMCRKFTDDRGVIRKPRQAAGFRGTIRYASISCHLQRELSRKDDVEVYMLAELVHASIPWRKTQDINEVYHAKRKVREETGMRELFAGCPPEFSDILKHVDSLKFYGTPDYAMIYALMRRAFETMKVEEFPQVLLVVTPLTYDWEKPAAPLSA